MQTYTDPNPSMEYILTESVYPIYKSCVKHARTLFTDETAIQSASASMFINLTRDSKTTVALESKLRERIANLNPDAIPSAMEVWKWHFRDLIAELGVKIIGQIAFCCSIGLSNEEIEQHINTYASQLRDSNRV